MVTDFNTSNPTGLLNELVDSAVEAAETARPPRDYIGGSRLGVECLRRLQYEYFNTPADPGRGFTGRLYRIFYRGHQGEEWLIKWLRMAGFELLTENPKNSRQYGFSVAGGRIRGHVDGVLINGPDEFGPYPRLWENKVLGAKYWRQVSKQKLKKYSPTYYGQTQIYMAYMQLDECPALWTALNPDTMEIYAENVPFDAENAQELSDRGVRVLQACDAGEQLPRVAKSSDFYQCKMCSYQVRCWGLGKD